MVSAAVNGSSSVMQARSNASSHPKELPDLEGKDVTEQVEILHYCIEKENRIKDGAEKILLVIERGEGNENLRKNVETELAAARQMIVALSAKLEQLRDATNSSRSRKKAAAMVNGKRGVFSNQTAQSSSAIPAREDVSDRDDFKTALHHATSQIQTLMSYQQRSSGHSFMIPSPQQSTFTTSSDPSVSPQSVMNDLDVDRSRTVVMTDLVTVLQRNARVKYELDMLEVMKAIVPALADYASKESRASAYRLIRHLIIDHDSLLRLASSPFMLDFYIVRTLARDNKHAIEKEQVIKLIRIYVEIGGSRRSPTVGAGNGKVLLSEMVMRSLVAVAEHGEDQFRFVVLETLAEIVLIDTDLIARTGAMRVLLQALVDGPHEIAPILATAFLYILDAPRTRSYLNPGTDIEIALSGLTDSYGKGPSHVEKMRSSSKVILVMLRTWSGLMYLCMDNMRGVSSLINMLRIPSLETREVILDLFFEVLNIDTPEWFKAYIDGRRLTMISTQKRHSHAVLSPPLQGSGLPITSNSSPSTVERLNLTHQYIALLLLVFIESGLLDALVGILEEVPNTEEQKEKDKGKIVIAHINLSRKATLLLGEILEIANTVLPLSIAARIQSLPRLFSLATDYCNNGESKTVAAATLSSIDSFNRNRSKLHKPVTQSSRQRANSIEDSVRRGQRQVEQVKVKLGMQVDDKAFQAILIETGVIIHKEHQKWNFDVLMDLIEGPLMNPKRLEEAIRVSKFGKKLMSFFYPFAGRFSSILNVGSNQRYIKLGCSFLTTLISCQEGIRFLAAEDPLLKQIVDCFHQLDPQFSTGPVSDPIFSKARMKDTLSFGYFEMLGTLSKHPEGIELMERFKMFTSFYHISELKSREDLIIGIIENIDYTAGGHPRIILSKALTSAYLDVRLYATNHLGQLIRSTPKANEWMLRLLLTQLYDPAEEVCELAVQYLEEACESMDVLELVVQMQPTLDHLGEIGHPLLLKFMSTPVGFRYLYKADYINREMEGWFHERNYQYVVQVEVYLAKSFGSNQSDEDDDLLVFDGTVPPHFYGEMAKTELGCSVLSDKGHFAEFAHFIRQHGLESEDFDLIIKLKSVLWAVGNIGATSGGLPFLEEEGIIADILNIAENSLVLSVRGTAFFVLGLISSTPQGAEVLDEFDWEATLTPLGQTTGLCIPLDVATFVRVPHWDCPIQESPPKRMIPPESEIEKQVITAISNLQNTVIANEAARSLTRLKTHHRRAFSSVSLFYRAIHHISTQRYRLPVRRYILDLFDVDLDPEVVGTLHTLSKTLHVPPRLQKRSASGSGTDGGENGRGAIGLGIDMDMLEMDDSVAGSLEDTTAFQIAQKPKTVLVPATKIDGFDFDDHDD